MAHGWCGYLYAALRFRPHVAEPLPVRSAPAPLPRLQPWRNRGGAGPAGLGWESRVGCDDDARLVQRKCRVRRALHAGTQRRISKRIRFSTWRSPAAWNVWEAGNGNGSLCCGEAGRAYALLTLGRHMHNDSAWLTRSAILADRAATVIPDPGERPRGLFRGRIGVALLAADWRTSRPRLSHCSKMKKAGAEGGNRRERSR